MKLVIEFSKAEKQAVIDAFELNLDQEQDKSYQISGKFGKITYRKNRSLEVDFVEGYFVEYSKIIKSFVTMLKSIAQMIVNLQDNWLEDPVVEEIEDDLICPVEKIEKDWERNLSVFLFFVIYFLIIYYIYEGVEDLNKNKDITLY